MKRMVVWLKCWALDIVLVGIMVVVGSYILAFSYAPPQQQTVLNPVPSAAEAEYTVPNTHGIMYFTKAE